MQAYEQAFLGLGIQIVRRESIAIFLKRTSLCGLFLRQFRWKSPPKINLGFLQRQWIEKFKPANSDRGQISHSLRLEEATYWTIAPRYLLTFDWTAPSSRLVRKVDCGRYE